MNTRQLIESEEDLKDELLNLPSPALFELTVYDMDGVWGRLRVTDRSLEGAKAEAMKYLQGLVDDGITQLDLASVVLSSSPLPSDA